ncbi:MAG: phosphoglycerate kinase [Thermoplasmata archaeon]
MDDFNLGGKRVLVRLDINSPIDPISGRILNDNRIRQHMATLRELRDARVAILAHQGRAGKDDFVTMEAHAESLSYYLGRDVGYVDSLFGKTAVEAIKGLDPGEFTLLENTRFYSEEIVLMDAEPAKMSSSHMVGTLAPLADFFINDAFAAAHRAQPSLVGFCEVLPSIAGRVMEREVEMLERAMHSEERPKIAILGGMKVDDSVAVARHMLSQGIVDRVLTAGVVANLFLWAEGRKLGEVNEDFLKKEVPACGAVLQGARDLLKKYPDEIFVPVDVVVNVKGEGRTLSKENLPSEYPIQDIGIDTIVRYLVEISTAQVIILNGPAGVFEVEEFSVGTRELFLAVAKSKGFKVIGGGHTVTAVEQLGVSQQMDHVSTGGGSLITYLAGQPLPVLDALHRSRARFKEVGPGG